MQHIPAKTNAALQNNYSWFDASPFTGNNFYRIKAINKDGSVQYSSVIKINIRNAKGSIQVSPNPVYNKTVNLQLNDVAIGTYTVSVYNTLGETLYRQGFQHAAGNASFTIKLNNVATGIYHVEMKNANENYRTTIMLQ